MRRISVLLALFLSLSMFTGCTAPAGNISPDESPPRSSAPQETATVQPADTLTLAGGNQNDKMVHISISIGDAVFEAQLYDNESAQALVEQLPLTLKMADYAGQEKVIALPLELPPAATEKPDNIRAGELYLWSGNQLVLFYSTFANSFDGYVRLGAIADADGLAERLGRGDVTVTIEPTHPREDRILVAYFSCTGNTAQIAEMIADITGAELYEIIPVVPYTSDDLNYNNTSSRATMEQNDPSVRPNIVTSELRISDYDTVFLGYPIWWGQAPKIISTFLESYDFRGKTIVPFCTSSSSGVGSSDTNLHSLCADSASWMPGERLPATASRETVTEWIDSLDIQTGNAT